MDELERKGQEIADALGVHRGSEPLVDAVRRTANQLSELQAEFRRWQESIRELAIAETGAPDFFIDGGACDSGDPLDLTLTEIKQGFAFLSTKLRGESKARS